MLSVAYDCSRKFDVQVPPSLKAISSEPIPAPDLILLLAPPKLEVDFDNVLEALLDLGLLEAGREASEGHGGESLPLFRIEL